MKNWGEKTITDIEDYLNKKFPEYGFGIFFYISERTDYVSKDQCISYAKTDKNFVQCYNTNDFYSEIRIFSNKKQSTKKDFLENISPDHIMNINQKLREHLESRTFTYDNCLKSIGNIVNDINDILLKRKNMPCSCHIGFINMLPMKGSYFTYKFINLEYMPLFFSYSNDSLSSNLYLFIVNN